MEPNEKHGECPHDLDIKNDLEQQAGKAPNEVRVGHALPFLFLLDIYRKRLAFITCFIFVPEVGLILENVGVAMPRYVGCVNSEILRSGPVVW